MGKENGINNLTGNPYWKRDPEKIARVKRRYILKKKYGLSLEDYEDMIAQQRGRCAICLILLDPKKICVDHCHSTEFIRGLLCHSCNNGIGLLKESSGILARASRYLEKANERQLARRRNLRKL